MFDLYLKTLMKTKDLDFPPLDRPKQPTSNDPNNTDYHTALIYDHNGHNTFYLPLIMNKGRGALLWDITGKKYIDFLAAFCSVNQGHCHPKIREAMIQQSEKLT